MKYRRAHGPIPDPHPVVDSRASQGRPTSGVDVDPSGGPIKLSLPSCDPFLQGHLEELAVPVGWKGHSSPTGGTQTRRRLLEHDTPAPTRF